ncbi:Fatty acid hydroxylase domain-containing protein 2 [Hypsizygus marmoreus]|uniref:Fatty acid hydroxylase domain-containing protein 2 n=1 Tax=Hypsizygus marmoreus TaxID=39966 RepID=A0A369KBW8_HYPMA|nr:Fatty acid hydroxylase domain-containing protein 2 [Hypsizygus marmoreus]
MSISSQWKHLLQNYSSSTLEFVGTSIVQFTCFWAVSAFYIALPYIFPAFSARHKLQKQEKQPTQAELWDCFKVVCRNQVFSAFLHISLLKIDTLVGRPPSYRFDDALPSLVEVVRDVAFGILIREILFYYAHRLFHHPSIYPTIHKPHHRFTAPVALAAQYASITEHILANILPISLPLRLTRSHMVTFWVFLTLELLETTTVHSGYDFFAGSARRHDSHHEKFVVNFGTVGILDWVHGTDGKKKEKRVE